LEFDGRMQHSGHFGVEIPVDGKRNTNYNQHKKKRNIYLLKRGFM
jgi:hypothetical protein